MDQQERFAFASGANLQFVDQMYAQYKSDPTSVDASWQKFFDGFEFALQSSSTGGGGIDGEEAKVEAFINAFRRLGHLTADTNPLKPQTDIVASMRPEAHGLAGVDPNKVFHPSNFGMKKPSSFSEIYQYLRDTYCGKIGPDYRDINDIESVLWLQERMESCRNKPNLDTPKKMRILQKLIEAEGFERFLQDRYLGQKRFSIEGLDSMIVLLDSIADESAQAGAEEINLGMAHRGRLNVLANFMGKEYEQILKEFEGAEYNVNAIEGDVKYHKGFANEVTTASGKPIRLYLCPNPSHLEAVNPVLEGFARARQRLLNDEGRSRIVPILIHGDAAVIGQGIVAETLNFANLSSYSTGGTIHIIANNQLGFTANPEETKSCDYASDIAKMIRAPVLHVNADDAESCVWAAQLAVAFRQKFKRDFVIDLIGYRRYGHNETDEPGFTQPLMYKIIKDHPSVLTLYSNTLIKNGIVTSEEFAERSKEFRNMLQQGMLLVREGKFTSKRQTPEKLQQSMYHQHATEADMFAACKTQVDQSVLLKVGEKILNLPPGFKPHPKISKLFESRLEMLKGEGKLDWGMAELMAYASLAAEGRHVRLSGQDCGRGTFTHRHAVLRDFETDKRLSILNLIGDAQAPVEVINSPLSEQGCLGFEFGYSVADPSSLLLWEAQFGDFANGAQIIIDQFLVASEAKWKQTSSLVMLLPHGYEGQGPEHSSARPERFLQACGNFNIQVVNLTTPAQLFHALRRQVYRTFKKPLIIMAPKSLLRHPRVVSKWAEFTQGAFAEVIDDHAIVDPKVVSRLVLCSGKIYYELLEAREKNLGKSENVALVRLEQLYPFAKGKITEVLAKYPNLSEVVWTQEEPANMGAWTFVQPRLKELLDPSINLQYIGRTSSGSTAEGSHKAHVVEQTRIVNEALTLAASIQSAQMAASKKG